MSTHWHPVGGNKLCRSPERVMFLGVSVIRVADKSEACGYVDRFSHASVSLWVRGRRGLSCREEAETDDCWYLWDWVAARTSCRSRTILFVKDAAVDLLTSGLLISSTTCGICIKDYVIEDPPTILWCTTRGRSLVIVSIDNYWRTSWLGVSDSFNKPTPLEYIKSCGSGCSLYQATLRRTCVEEFGRALMSSIRSGNLGNFPLTISGLAWNSYRHRFMSNQPVCHSVAQALEVEREAHYGGKNAVLYRGEYGSTVYEIDCNSLYPYIMSTKAMPRVLRGALQAPRIASLDDKLRRFICCARVKINSKEDTYPVRRGGRTRYCRGKFWTVLCGDELRRAAALQQISDISYLCWYEACDLFSEYVGYWHSCRMDARARGDYPSECIAKACLNSLYGRFCKRTDRWEVLTRLRNMHDFGEYGWYDSKRKRWTTARWVRGCGQIRVDDSLDDDSCPIISACITAGAREYIREIIDECGIRNCLAVHTDALIVNEEGRRILEIRGYLDPFHIGRFKIVSGGRCCNIERVNCYTIGDNGGAGRGRRGPVQGHNNVGHVDRAESLRHRIMSGASMDLKYRKVVSTQTLFKDHDGSAGSGWLDPPTLID